MKTIEREFLPIILGNDINTYSVARAFYEEYKIKSIVLGKYRSGPSNNSKIVDFYDDKNLDNQEVFFKTIDSFADKYLHKRLILLGCGDNYAELIIKNKYNFKDNVIAPYIDESLMNDLIKKSKFYE
ncbi:MAG: ATP-grasp domain-containing protein, partial [Firmicutes bacterium]|nr:ATP-grasp domain-containing protein [Bacillota bacterium]